MADLSDYGIDEGTLRQMLDEWRSGVKKTHLEEKYLHNTASHGKVFSSLVRRYLGVETERVHPLVEEVHRLRQLLLEHGIDPRAAD